MATDYAMLPGALGENLQEGAIDFWVRFDPRPNKGEQGVISRDAEGEDKPCHLLILRLPSDSLGARVQSSRAFDGAEMRCAPKLEQGRWYHVGLNFGGGQHLALYLDGQEVSEVAASGTKTPCTAPTAESLTTSIGGNSEPWILGAASWLACSGTSPPAPLTHPFDGAIANLRISNVRRAFGPIELD